MIISFLKDNKKEILETARSDLLSLTGVRPSSKQLKLGLPIFFQQLVTILYKETKKSPELTIVSDNVKREEAAGETNEIDMAFFSEHPGDVDLVKSAVKLGAELLHLGYTLSHAIHIYGSLCQAITGLARIKSFAIKPLEFQILNRCLDVAIAGAVTEFQSLRDSQTRADEVERHGFLAHELRNSLSTTSISFQMIKSGEVGLTGNVSLVLENSLKRMDELITKSLIEVKLMGTNKPVLDLRSINLLLLIDQLLISAEVEAKKKKQVIDVQISQDLTINADTHFMYSALSNLIQNAIKYTPNTKTIQIRAKIEGDDIVIEVEDECGGLTTNNTEELFKPYEQQSKNREGLGLGLSLARKAIELHNGTISVRNLPNKGCVFTISLPKNSSSDIDRKKA